MINLCPVKSVPYWKKSADSKNAIMTIWKFSVVSKCASFQNPTSTKGHKYYLQNVLKVSKVLSQQNCPCG